MGEPGKRSQEGSMRQTEHNQMWERNSAIGEGGFQSGEGMVGRGCWPDTWCWKLQRGQGKCALVPQRFAGTFTWRVSVIVETEI